MLPPPSTITRLPILSMWPNETLDEPVDADVDVRRRFLAAGDVEIAPARRAGADEDRVVAFAEQRLQDYRCADRTRSSTPSRGCSRPLRRSPIRAGGTRGICVRIMPPAARVAVEHGDVVAERRQIARDGQRRRARRRSARRACRSSSRGACGIASRDVVLVVGGDALQAADRDGFRLLAFSSSTRPRRHAGSHGRSQVRPRMPGKTLDSQLTM